MYQHSRLLMFKLSLIIFVAQLVTICPLFAKVGFVDYRQLLLNHPLIRNFDFKTQRFLNTPSAWVSNKKQAEKLYANKLSELEAEYKKLDKSYRSIYKKISGDRKNDMLFFIWHRKAEIKLLEYYLKKAIVTCKTEEPYLHGAATGIETLIPLIQQVDADIKNTVTALSRRYENMPIMDISCFAISRPQYASNHDLLYSNFHRKLWSFSKIKSEDLKLWKKTFQNFLTNNYENSSFSPFVYGFKDLRQESVKSMSLTPRN